MHDFLLEKRLTEEAPHLHKLASDSTDHSMLHSLDVLEFCNLLLDEQVQKLSIAECYVLVMACYLHDVGMAINSEEFVRSTKELGLDGYKDEHPDYDEADIIRDFHHEYGGLFIRKYADLFDIPTDTLVFAIVQIPSHKAQGATVCAAGRESGR